MAMIQCRECGADISDSAATCPKCGVPAPGGTGTLTFIRPQFRNGAIGVEVYVDGQPFGNLRMKGRLSVSVAPGDHHIELLTSQGKSGVGSVTTRSGETTLTVSLSVLGAPRIE
jgi:zinc-ribbon domain